VVAPAVAHPAAVAIVVVLLVLLWSPDVDVDEVLAVEVVVVGNVGISAAAASSVVSAFVATESGLVSLLLAVVPALFVLVLVF
jgi:hypothetical protein